MTASCTMSCSSQHFLQVSNDVIICNLVDATDLFLLPNHLLSRRQAPPFEDDLRHEESRLRPVHQQGHSGGDLRRMGGPNEPLHLPSETQGGLPGHQLEAHGHPRGRLRRVRQLHGLRGSQGPLLRLQHDHHDVHQPAFRPFPSHVPSGRRRWQC